MQYTLLHLHPAGIKPKQIGILVVNCSLFNPTPSLASMIINHFKMRSNIISYNLSGESVTTSWVNHLALDVTR